MENFNFIWTFRIPMKALAWESVGWQRKDGDHMPGNTDTGNVFIFSCTVQRSLHCRAYIGGVENTVMIGLLAREGKYRSMLFFSANIKASYLPYRQESGIDLLIGPLARKQSVWTIAPRVQGPKVLHKDTWAWWTQAVPQALSGRSMGSITHVTNSDILHAVSLYNSWAEVSNLQWDNERGWPIWVLNGQK